MILFVVLSLFYTGQANSIGPDGVTELAHLIGKSPSLKKLDINSDLKFMFLLLFTHLLGQQNWT